VFTLQMRAASFHQRRSTRMKRRILTRKGLRLVDLNRKMAIRHRCVNCSGWSTREVRKCTFTDCPLFPYRMGQGKQPAKERNESILAYCKWCANGSSKEVSKCPAETCPLWIFRNTRSALKKAIYAGENRRKAEVHRLIYTSEPKKEKMRAI
jgi:Tfp pilus assembly protein PilV